MQEVENEIEVIESIVSDLESAISEVKDCSYFEYKIATWEDDLRDLNERLEELYDMQNNYWNTEMKQQNIDFEEARL